MPAAKAPRQGKLSFARKAVEPREGARVTAERRGEELDEHGVAYAPGEGESAPCGAAAARPLTTVTPRRGGSRVGRRAGGTLTLDELLGQEYAAVDPIDSDSSDGGRDDSVEADDGGLGGEAARRRDAAGAALRMSDASGILRDAEALQREMGPGDGELCEDGQGDGSAEEVLCAASTAGGSGAFAAVAPTAAALGCAGVGADRAADKEQHATALLAGGWIADALAPQAGKLCDSGKAVPRAVSRWLFGLVAGDAVRHRQAAVALAAALGVDPQMAAAHPVAAVGPTATARAAAPRRFEWLPSAEDLLSALQDNGYVHPGAGSGAAEVACADAYAPEQGVAAPPDAVALDRVGSLLLVAAALAAAELGGGRELPRGQDDGGLLEMLVVAARVLALDARTAAARPFAEAALSANARAIMARGGDAPARASARLATCAARLAAVAAALVAASGCGAPSAAARALCTRAARVALHASTATASEPASCIAVLEVAMPLADRQADEQATRGENLVRAAQFALVGVALAGARGVCADAEGGVDYTAAFDACGVDATAPPFDKLSAFVNALDRLQARVRRSFHDDGRAELRRAADYLMNRLKYMTTSVAAADHEAATPTARASLNGDVGDTAAADGNGAAKRKRLDAILEEDSSDDDLFSCRVRRR